jgi:hypothetical protein
VNDKTKYIEGLRRLAESIKSIEYYHTLSVYAGRHAMNSGRSFLDVVDHPDVKAWRQFKDDIVAELNAAIKIGLQYQCELPHCRKLAVELSQGYKEGLSLVDAMTEVCLEADKLGVEERTKSRGNNQHWVELAIQSGKTERRERAQYVFSKLDGNEQKALLAEFKECKEYCGKLYSNPMECVIAKIMRKLERKKA